MDQLVASETLLLDWAIMAVSLFNTILLTWLGLTVLLNADRRDWGIWLASAGLLLGGAFFVSHTAVLGVGPLQLSWRSMIFWWIVGMVPAIILPIGWYVIILWYTGFWNNPSARLRRRQYPWLIFTVTLLVIGLMTLALGVVLLAVPSPELTSLRLFIRWSIAGIPLLALGYSVYAVLCIGLSLDALRRPEPSQRVMGSLARRRAHPWLVATAVALLVVSLLGAGVVLWLVQYARQRTFLEIYLESTRTISRIDLVIATIISVAIILLGQAIVSYEVFTGKTLPRRGLLRHWRRAMILAAGYGVLVGGSMVVHLQVIYSLLLTALLMTFFFALFSWRSYAERERHFATLRPFVTSQHLYEQLLTQSVPPDVDFVTPFRALCTDVLGTRIAYLVALGPLAPLVRPPLVYPEGQEPALPPLAEIATHFNSPQTMSISLDSGRYGGAEWAIPLWSERGLIGVFLLGEKQDGGLYTQEEIEIARVIGERLIDTQASAEIGRRLMALQRERLAQSQVIDRQTRRVLHDDILPTLQSATIALDSTPLHSSKQVTSAISLIAEAHRQISDLLRHMPTTTVPEVTRLGLVRALQRAVGDELGEAFDVVSWQIDPAAARQAQSIPSLTAEVIFYAAREVIRNAAHHGRGDQAERPLCLTIALSWNNGLVLQIEDNGVGLAGADTPALKGSGQGLALHSTMMAVVGGTITVESVTREYTRVQLALPQES